MADTARGAVSMTPVVTVAADSDSDSVDVIHHDIKQTLGGKLEYVKANDNDKWFYSTSKDVSTDADLISGTYTDAGTVATGDHVKFLYLEHSGTSDGTTANTADLLITLDGGNPISVVDVIEIGSGESIILKFKDGLDVASLHASSDNGSTIRCTVAAIIDDVA